MQTGYVIYLVATLALSPCIPALAASSGDPFGVVTKMVDRPPYADMSRGWTIIPDKTILVLGESLWITATWTNHEDKAVSVLEGPRVATSMDFDVTAVDDKGHRFPPEYGIAGNELMKRTTVYVDQSYSRRLFLGDWLRFDKPGKYTISCVGYGKAVPTDFTVVVQPRNANALGVVINGYGALVNGTDKDAAFESAIALSAIPDERTIPYLAVAVKSGQRGRTVEALCQFPSNDAAVALIPALASMDMWDVQWASTCAKKGKVLPYVLAVLATYAKDPDPSKRLVASSALPWFADSHP